MLFIHIIQTQPIGLSIAYPEIDDKDVLFDCRDIGMVGPRGVLRCVGAKARTTSIKQSKARGASLHRLDFIAC